MFDRYVTISFILCVTLHPILSDYILIKDVVTRFLQKRCETNGGTDAFKELEKAASNFQDCALDSYFILSKAKNENEAFHLVCTEARDSLLSCLASLTDTIEPCLDKEEMYISDFISGWINSTFEEHCKDGIETFREHELLLTDLNCTPKEDIDNEELLERCFAMSTVVKDIEFADFVITKPRLCGYLEKGNECLIEFLKENCQERVYKFFKYHLKPTKIWCDENTIND